MILALRVSAGALIVAFAVVFLFISGGLAAAYQCGTASWYGPGFNGRPTASAERFNQNAMTAAHPSLPFGTIVSVRNQKTGKVVKVRINDRGPYVGGRVIDLSKAAATKLGMIQAGTAKVCLTIL